MLVSKRQTGDKSQTKDLKIVSRAPTIFYISTVRFNRGLCQALSNNHHKTEQTINGHKFITQVIVFCMIRGSSFKLGHSEQGWTALPDKDSV